MAGITISLEETPMVSESAKIFTPILAKTQTILLQHQHPKLHHKDSRKL